MELRKRYISKEKKEVFKLKEAVTIKSDIFNQRLEKYESKEKSGKLLIATLSNVFQTMAKKFPYFNDKVNIQITLNDIYEKDTKAYPFISITSDDPEINRELNKNRDIIENKIIEILDDALNAPNIKILKENNYIAFLIVDETYPKI